MLRGTIAETTLQPAAPLCTRALSASLSQQFQLNLRRSQSPLLQRGALWLQQVIQARSKHPLRGPDAAPSGRIGRLREKMRDLRAPPTTDFICSINP
jgi:hypothetical protein